MITDRLTTAARDLVVVDGVPSRLDRRRQLARIHALGDAVVGPTAARAFRTLSERAGLDLSGGPGR